MKEDDLSEWMTKLPAEIKERPITKLAMPGSHDSFACPSDLSTAFPVANDTDQSIRRAGKLPCVRRFIKRWAVTQDLDIDEQLRAGVRYFDLRVSLPPKEDRVDSFRLVHALYGSRLIDTMRRVKAFLDWHPKEVVLLDMNHLYGFNVETDLSSMMQDVLSVFARSQIAPPPSSCHPISSYTLRRLQDSGFNVILITPVLQDRAYENLLWNTNNIQSPWPDSDKIPYIMRFIDQLSRMSRALEQPEALLVFQGVATVNPRDLIYHPFSTLKSYVAEAMTEAVCDWLFDLRCTDGINIVIADFVTRDYCRMVVSINTRK